MLLVRIENIQAKNPEGQDFMAISLKIRGFTAIFSLRNTPATFDAYDCDDGQAGRDVVAGF